ncbi:MAG: barstar family protein [Planctomycetes bacterium]|nr:barstar family protein [Planctomycetota bacterium]
MNAKTLIRLDGPWLHASIGDSGELVDELRVLEKKGKLTVRVIRGRKASTVPKFFDEIAAALQLPPQFGENWDSLLDCLSDTHWSDAKSLVICFLHGSRLLETAASDQQGHLREVFEETAKRLKKAGRSFHAIWHTTIGEAAALKARWPDLSPLE